jgi:transcriptional regulator with XRE-family HTH domain
MNYLQIGKKIRKLRIERAMSQQRLAEKIGVSWEMISRYERGKSSPLQKILLIADALNVPSEVFFQQNQAEKSQFNEDLPTYNAPTNNTWLVPLINSLPKNVKDIYAVIQDSAYLFSPSISIEHKYGRKDIFAIDIANAPQLDIRAFRIYKEGILLCQLLHNGDITPANKTLPFITYDPVAKKYSLEIDPDAKKIKIALVVQWVITF